MPRKGKDLIFESFEDRRSTIVVGLLCLLYFIFSYLPESGWIAKILPFWPLPILAVLASLTVTAQAIAWKLFRHFKNHWYRDLRVWILFWCEFGLIFFTVVFVSWPAYFIYRTLNKQPGAGL